MNKINEMKYIAEKFNGYFTNSRKGVPYAVVPFKGKRASVCWFGKGKFFRLFDNYMPFSDGSNKQNKHDFGDMESVISYLKEQDHAETAKEVQ